MEGSRSGDGAYAPQAANHFVLCFPHPFSISSCCLPPPTPIPTCMAAIPHWKRAIGFGKRFSDHISTGAPPCQPPASAAAAARRGVHGSVYDKNPEEHVRPAFVPDDVIQQQSAGKYWGPHPATGVFGPADNDGRRPDPAASAAASPGNGGSSVLDQKAWFRPLEGVDAPHLP